MNEMSHLVGWREDYALAHERLAPIQPLANATSIQIQVIYYIGMKAA